MPDGSTKAIVLCSPDELRAEAASRMMQGNKLIQEAESLFTAADMMEGQQDR
jgi:hypothetical protein